MSLHTSPVQILLAGSNNFRWRSYQKRLETAGYSTRLTSSGVDCIAALREFRPNVLVLDPNIPWGGGDGVLALRDEEPELRSNLVMILTARCEPGLLYRLSNYPIDDLVGHLITPAFLQWRLERLLELRREGPTCLTASSAHQSQFDLPAERVVHAARVVQQACRHD